MDEVIYKATVSSGNSVETYKGPTDGTFKARHGEHKTSFNIRKYSNTTLSKYVWKLNDENINHCQSSSFQPNHEILQTLPQILYNLSTFSTNTE